MIFKEEKRNLLSVDKDEYYFAQAISKDYAIVSEIIDNFDSTYNMKNPIMENGEQIIVSPDKSCILVNNKVFNLIIKPSYYKKPSYETLKKSLLGMKIIMLKHTDIINKSKLAMPKIACGVDQLEWDKVKEIIKEVFQDTNLEILVCFL